MEASSFGVVEGFYWQKNDAYNGQYGEYSHEQRRELLEFMSYKGLNVYVYDPKIVKEKENGRTLRAIECLQGEAVTEWQLTFKLAREKNIQFIWGITPPTLENGTINKVVGVIEKVIEYGAAGVALLFDDVEIGSLKGQAECIRLLWERFQEKICAYCPPCYYGEPKTVEKKLECADSIIPKSIPFIFTGVGVWSQSIQEQHLPRFANRNVILWDNWIASDKLALSNFNPIPPLHRADELLNRISGYWLNVVFPLERALPCVSSIQFLKEHKKSPKGQELHRLIDDIAKEWAEKMDCSVAFTRAVLKIKLHPNEDNYTHEKINPNVGDIIQESDIHSVDLLLKNGFDGKCSVKDGKTVFQLADEAHNYPLAKFLSAKGLEGDVDWNDLKARWKNSCKPNCYIPNCYIPKKGSQEWLQIINSVDRCDTATTQQLLKKGVSPKTTNTNGYCLADIAQWHYQKTNDMKYHALSVYLHALNGV